jgi:hypothetical protein
VPLASLLVDPTTWVERRANASGRRLVFRHGNDYLAVVGALSFASEVPLLNRTDRPSPMPGEAEVKYLDGDFRVVRPGAFVRCAVTGVSIPLEELRYWSVDLQEAYATPEAVLQRHSATYARKV